MTDIDAKVLPRQKDNFLPLFPRCSQCPLWQKFLVFLRPWDGLAPTV